MNGESLGEKPCTRDEKFTASFEVPFCPGELLVVGYAGENAIIEKMLKTAGVPSKIRLSPDRGEIQSGGDLSFITVEILDADDQIHPCANNKIFFTVKGPGEILAVGNANPTSEESYIGN